MRWLDGIADSMHMNLSKLQEIAEDRGAWCVLSTLSHRVTTRDRGTDWKFRFEGTGNQRLRDTQAQNLSQSLFPGKLASQRFLVQALNAIV